MTTIVGWLALILLAACGGNQSTEVDAPGTSAVTDSLIVTSYEVDDSLFPNPERGFYRRVEMKWGCHLENSTGHATAAAGFY